MSDRTYTAATERLSALCAADTALALSWSNFRQGYAEAAAGAGIAMDDQRTARCAWAFLARISATPSPATVNHLG